MEELEYDVVTVTAPPDQFDRAYQETLSAKAAAGWRLENLAMGEGNASESTAKLTLSRPKRQWLMEG